MDSVYQLTIFGTGAGRKLALGSSLTECCALIAVYRFRLERFFLLF